VSSEQPRGAQGVGPRWSGDGWNPAPLPTADENGSNVDTGDGGVSGHNGNGSGSDVGGRQSAPDVTARQAEPPATATTAPAAPAASRAGASGTTRPGGAAGPVTRITFREALDSEWAKIRTVRSTYWTLIIAVLVSVGLSVVITAATVATWNSLSESTKRSISVSYTLAGVNFGVLVIGVLGVLVISSEYSSGMIRTSLTALPRRVPLLAAKATVLAVLCLVIGLVITFASYFLNAPFYGGKGVSIPLGHTANLRAVLAAAVYLVLVALMGFAFGAILRHTAGAITVTVGVMFVLPIITAFLPGSVGKFVNKVMPSNAGSSMMSTAQDASSTDTSTHLTPLSGFLVLACTVAVLCAIAFALFEKRDA
jgi:ABC-type transport system involved in multi-copper enzyme maturation permease subunit